MTEWREIPGFDGRYKISDAGVVVSRRGALSVHFYKGYPQVSLWRNGKTFTRGVHSLVALAFLGPRPEGMEVCHNDGDNSNPDLSNLRYDTRTENARDLVRHGRNFQAKKTHCKNGHEFTPENTAIRSRPGGGRNCLTCASRAYQKMVKERRRLTEVSVEQIGVEAR